MDPSVELQAALIAALKADPSLAAAFAGAAVRVFDTAPPNIRGDYIILAFFQPLPLNGTDGAETEVTLDIWSLTDPPGKAKAMAIGEAAVAAALAITDLPSHLVDSSWLTSSQYLTDGADQVTAHGIVKLEFVTQPKA